MRLLVWANSPFDGTTGIAECLKSQGHESTMHEGRLNREIEIAETGEKHRPIFVWWDDDRRLFRGELELCPESCVLPKGHHGEHVS